MLLFQQISQFFYGILRDWKEKYWKKDRQSCAYVFSHEQKWKYWKCLHKIVLMRCKSYFEDWGLLGAGCVHSKSCTQNPVLKWTKKSEFSWFSQTELESSFSCSRLTLASFHWCHWHDFWLILLFQGFLKVVFLYYTTTTIHGISWYLSRHAEERTGWG